ncbi:MAG: type ISP restriction/modification enzyme, partial [Chloroflexota bacterium]
SKVKYDAPVMVVLGNPPYSYESGNTGEWISQLIRAYYQVDGKPLGERNPKGLQDDYVKFIRFAQWRIERTGYGILAFISNHGYLDNPTFRGMRQSLMQTFDDIYLLDLHGNSKKKERSPDGSPDQNVFDIQQGVTIGFFVKRPIKQPKNAGTIFHSHLWGKRDDKYQILLSNDVSTTQWTKILPKTPAYFFMPQDTELLPEYEQGWQLTTIFPTNSLGVVTARDDFTVHWLKDEVWKTVVDFIALPPENARERYNLGKDSRDWQVAMAQKDLRIPALLLDKVIPYFYRPFDIRYTYYTGNSRGFHCMPRNEVMQHLRKKENRAFCFIRRSREQTVSNFYAAKYVIDKTILSSADNANVAPLYLYPNTEKTTLFDGDEPTDSPNGRKPNLAPAFTTELAEKIGLKFIQDGKGDLQTTFGPEDLFHYIYAVFHSPTYRTRYAEFLKLDFPKVPLTSQLDLFRALCGFGEKLVALHLMEQAGPSSDTPAYPESGSNTVELVKYVEPLTNGELQQPGRVYLNKQQYFEGVPPNVWGFHIGGYQVCEKWLKDRKGRTLTYDELNHYQGIVAALAETSRLMTAIDQAIGEQGGWPLQ